MEMLGGNNNLWLAAVFRCLRKISVKHLEEAARGVGRVLRSPSVAL